MAGEGLGDGAIGGSGGAIGISAELGNAGTGSVIGWVTTGGRADGRSGWRATGLRSGADELMGDRGRKTGGESEIGWGSEP